MKLNNTIILYAILGIISLAIAYVTAVAAKMSSWIPENTTQGVLVVVFACTALMGILFFIPVATGLSLLLFKK